MSKIDLSSDECFEQNKWRLGVWELNKSTVTVLGRSDFEGIIFKLRSLSSKFNFKRDFNGWIRSNISPKAYVHAIGRREEDRLSLQQCTIISKVGNTYTQYLMPVYQCRNTPVLYSSYYETSLFFILFNQYKTEK